MPLLEPGLPMPWYRRADYARMREICTDGETFPPTFDKWQGLEEKHERGIQRSSGEHTFRVYIDPDEFIAWCAAHERPTDLRAREVFADDPRHWPEPYRSM